MLGEGPIYDINGSFGSLEKTFSINFNKSKKNFISPCIAMVIIVFSLLMELKPLFLKKIMEMLTF